MAEIFQTMNSVLAPRGAGDAAEGNPECPEIAFLIARFLLERGVDRVFSLCGGHILPIWDHAARNWGHPLKGPCQEKKALLRKKKWFLENPTH